MAGAGRFLGPYLMHVHVDHAADLPLALARVQLVTPVAARLTLEVDRVPAAIPFADLV